MEPAKGCILMIMLLKENLREEAVIK